MVRVALGLVLVRATVGLISGDAKVYLGQEVAIDALIGLTVLGSVAVGQPARPAVRARGVSVPRGDPRLGTFVRTFRTVTLVWGIYFLVRSAVRLTALLTLSVDGYLLVDAVSGAPVPGRAAGLVDLPHRPGVPAQRRVGRGDRGRRGGRAKLQAEAASRLSP